MTPKEAARILSPIQIGFTAARLRLRELREEAESKTGAVAFRTVADLDAAEDYLKAREAQWNWEGLLSAVLDGNRPCCWPNVLPDEEAMQAMFNAWMEGKPEMRAKVEDLKTSPQIQRFRRLVAPSTKVAGAS